MYRPEIKSLIDFWSDLSTETQQFSGTVCLANLDVPFFLSNAAWLYTTSSAQAVKTWYKSKNLPIALILDPKQTLSPIGFSRKEQFRLRQTRASASNVVVEQVSWSQMHLVGELLASHYEQAELSFAIAKCLTNTMQDNQAILAFVAFNETAAGTSITLETEHSLITMLTVDDGSIENHLHTLAESLGKEAFILELSDPHESSSTVILERWVLDES